MRKVCVFTGTRAEYGSFYWLMKDIQAEFSLTLQILATGSHFSHEFGLTYQEIEKDGFEVNEKVEMLLSSDSAVGVAKSMGLGTIGYADALERLQPDILIVLGDRFETLAVAQVAMIMKITILHLHGGERTDGAYDDAIRHAITKLSNLHGTSNEVHRQRVIQLGEAPERVWNVGAVGLEHLNRTTLLTNEQLSKSLNFEITGPFFLITYHPVTLMDEDPKVAINKLLAALDKFPAHQVILTFPNADSGGRQIIPLLKAYVAKDPKRALAVESLGQLRYLSALSMTDAMIGNSSSGIVEAPAFKKATVNIGSRQEGRMAADSVINCQGSEVEITQAIEKALSCEFIETLKLVVNPYGQENTCEKVIKILTTAKLGTIKSFVDVQF
jgi:UDP-N-acetylglucosamine 2-epimerase (non-hydrolysing)